MHCGGEASKWPHVVWAVMFALAMVSRNCVGILAIDSWMRVISAAGNSSDFGSLSWITSACRRARFLRRHGSEDFLAHFLRRNLPPAVDHAVAIDIDAPAHAGRAEPAIGVGLAGLIRIDFAVNLDAVEIEAVGVGFPRAFGVGEFAEDQAPAVAQHPGHWRRPPAATSTLQADISASVAGVLICASAAADSGAFPAASQRPYPRRSAVETNPHVTRLRTSIRTAKR